MSSTSNVRSQFSAWGFLAFPLAVILVFTAIPTLAGIALSFFAWDGGAASPHFIGLENYRRLFASSPFLPALRNTLLIAIISVPITIILGFLIAAALHARWFLGRTAARTIFFLPTVVSIVAIGFIWRWLLDPTDSGLFNHLIRAAATLFGVTVTNLPDWLGNSPWGLATIMLVSIWRGLGFAIVLNLAALSNLSRSQFDAAAVDGATPWQSLWHIAWPGIRPTTFFLTITSLIGALQVFDLVLVMIGTVQQPWTDVLNLYLYREFSRNRLGFAAAIGVIVLLLSILAVLIPLAISKWRTSLTSRRTSITTTTTASTSTN